MKEDVFDKFHGRNRYVILSLCREIVHIKCWRTCLPFTIIKYISVDRQVTWICQSWNFLLLGIQPEKICMWTKFFFIIFSWWIWCFIHTHVVIKYERNMLILQQWWSWKYLHYAVVIDDNWRELWRWEVMKLSYDVSVYDDDEI